ncbi:MAG: metal-sulfur cluster assembly factor [Chloroflexi bacterium]|uniref:Metal-sulfur cluster assembly factor n=1 Tax=Candidatus Chlorohelix allophototropha TaxID=3003348 RepID=A0A8T7M9X5_9CHLR|nr:metal-sulfur cluster assembly factor [Chloroflexota bacterium]WJW68860.1 metal-sulfur cluster assembly factor [Chloroflexota bacterium L227-S17]
MAVASDEEIIKALKTVTDPELGVNIIDLGLVYRLDIDDTGEIEIFMTLTTPACPAGPEIRNDVKNVLSELPGVNGVKINFVWSPPWGAHMISEQGKEELGWMDGEF